MSEYVAERTDASVPVQVVVSANGGVTGLTVVVAIRDADSSTSFLDFADLTFRAAGHATKFASVADIGNGRYSLAGGLNVAGITNLPATTHHLVAEFDISGSVVAAVDDVIEILSAAYAVAEPGDAMDLIADAVDESALAADTDTYQAKVWMFDDENASVDRYAVLFHKNGQPVLSGVSSPTIQVFKASDGVDLVAATALTAVAATGVFRHDESTNRITDGAAFFARVAATIDAATRTWIQPIGRDSQ